MRFSTTTVWAAVALSVLAAPGSLAQEAGQIVPTLRGAIVTDEVIVDGPPADVTLIETETVDPLATDALDPIGTNPALPATRQNPRVAAAPMIDASDPPTFIAGNALRRTLNEDPYAALGIRTGSFLLFPSVDLSTGYTSNTTDTKDGGGAWLAIVAPELLIQSDWSRHEAALSLRGSYETYSDDTRNAPEFDAEATTRLDFADRWHGDFRAAYFYGTESLSDPNLPAGVNESPDVHDFAGSAALSGAFGRHVFTAEVLADRSLYGDAKSGGQTISQRDRNNTLYGGRLRLGYEMTRTFVPFVEAVLTHRVYDQRTDDLGIERASRGDGLRAGFAFDRSPVSSGELALGYLRETFDDSSLDTLSAFTVDGLLVWAPTRLTTVTTAVLSSIEPTTDPASSGSVVYDAGVDVAYAWRPNVVLAGAAGARYEGFQGTDQVDWTYELGLAATWRINRSAELALGYVHEWRESTDRSNNYDSDTVRLDLRVKR